MRVKWETVWNPQQTYLKRVAVLAFWLFVWLPMIFPIGVFVGALFGLMIGLNLMVRWATDDPTVVKDAADAWVLLRNFFLAIVVPCP